VLWACNSQHWAAAEASNAVWIVADAVKVFSSSNIETLDGSQAGCARAL